MDYLDAIQSAVRAGLVPPLPIQRTEPTYAERITGLTSLDLCCPGTPHAGADGVGRTAVDRKAQYRAALGLHLVRTAADDADLIRAGAAIGRKTAIGLAVIRGVQARARSVPRHRALVPSGPVVRHY